MKRSVLSAVIAAVTLSGYAQTKPDLAVIFDQASQAMQAGNYAQAETGFREVLATDPANFAALGNLGVLYARTHRFAEAIATDDRALHLDPNDSGILLNLGLAYMKDEEYARARPYLERLEATGKGGTRATLLLATSMILGDAPQAGLDLLLSRKLETADPSALYLEAVAYARLNQVEAGEEVFAQLLSNGSTRAQANFLLGQALHDGHRLQEAADSFTATLKLDPTYPGAHRELGKVYISMQRFGDAERELKVATLQDPQDGSAQYFLGALLVQSDQEAEGVPYLTKAQSLLPDSWAIPFYLGKARMKANRPAEAVALLQQAAAMNADEPQVFYLLAGALKAVGRGEEAKVAMTRVQALHSSALEAEKQSMNLKVAGAR